jgi:TolB-like protein
VSGEGDQILFEFAGFVVDPQQRVIRSRKDGGALEIGNRAFDALLILLQSCGELVQRSELMERLWPRVVVEENNLTQTIYTLRQLLGEKPGENRIIATVPGRGYRFVAPVHRRVVVSATRNESRASIAVLPFFNLTGDASKEYWGDGIAEELIVSLGKVPGLKVPARISTFAYKGRLIDVRQIGKELGVSFVVEGGVRSAGDRIRISAHLSDAESGYRLWSESFDRQIRDLFALQDEMAAAIRSALVERLGPDLPSPTPRAGRAVDVEAYHLYIQGVYLMDRISVVNMNRAINLFRASVARDPGFARGYEAIAAGLLGFTPLGLQTFGRLQEAQDAAKRALALDPTLSDAHDSLGCVAFFEGRWQEAKGHLEMALRLGESDALVHWHAALWYVQFGQLQAASKQAERSYALASISPSSVSVLVFVRSLQDRDDEALSLAQVAVNLGMPLDTRPLALVFEAAARRRRRYLEAAAACLGGLDTNVLGQHRHAESIRMVYSALDNPRERADAIAAVKELYAVDVLRAERMDIAAFGLAMASAECLLWLDAIDDCFELSHRLVDAMAPNKALMFMRSPYFWNVECRQFRHDAQFLHLAQRTGLLDCWRHFGPPDEAEVTAAFGALEVRLN